MNIKILEQDFSVCQVRNLAGINHRDAYFFISNTPQGISLICPSKSVPANKTVRNDGWKALQVGEDMGFEKIAVIADLTAVLAGENIPVLVISDYGSDFVLLKEEHLIRAVKALCDKGYGVL